MARDLGWVSNHFCFARASNADKKSRKHQCIVLLGYTKEIYHLLPVDLIFLRLQNMIPKESPHDSVCQILESTIFVTW